VTARVSRRAAIVARHVVAATATHAPCFAGSARPVVAEYGMPGKGRAGTPASPLPPGLRESIRDAEGQPTNCDDGKHWIKDIAAANPSLPPYKWFCASSPPPFVELPKPLAECKVGLIATSGCYVAGDCAYIYRDNDMHRVIPANTPTSQLRFSHFTENWLVDARRDPNCVFPIEAMRSLVTEGVIGALPTNLFSVMGANYSIKQTSQDLAPKMAELLHAEGVDAVLVVPM